MRRSTSPVGGGGLLALGLALLCACGPQEAPQAAEPLKSVAHSAPATLPDLVVRDLVLPRASAPGVTVEVSFEVCNRTAVAAGPFQVELLLSTDTSFTAADPKLLRLRVEGLGPSACRSVRQGLLPPAIAHGLYHVAAVADADGQVSEEDEANNLAPAGTFGLGNLPDFTVTAVKAPAVVEYGQPMTVSVTVCNHGTVQATPRVWFLMSDDATVTGEESERGFGAWVDLLGPGECRDVTWEQTAPWTWQRFWLGARVDPLDEAAEFNESDNLWVGGRMAVVTLPDLVVTDVSGPPSVPTGTAFSTWATVCNQGSRPTTAASEVELYLSRDDSIGPEDLPLAYAPVAPLQAGQCARVRLGVISSGVPAGTWYLGAEVDDYVQAVEEAFEDNNSAAGTRLRAGEAPDFTVTSLEAPSALRPGEPSVARVTVCNEGTVGAPVDVGLYLSGDRELLLPEDPSAGSLGVGFLEPGQCAAQAVPFSAPEGLADTRYLIARVDAGDVWAELDEDDNTHVGGRLYLGSGFDLTVTSLEVPPSVRAGAPFLARARVCNRGNAPSPGYDVVVRNWLPSDPTAFGYSYVELPSLAAGACAWGEVSMNLGYSPLGEHWLLRAAAYPLSGEDPFPGNDAHPVPVPLGVGPRPDFTITSVVTPPSVLPGQSFTAAVTVCNQGTVAGGSDVAVVLSQDPEVSIRDLFAGWAETGPLPAGACVTLEVPSHAGSLWPGLFTVGAVVNPYESTEGLPSEYNELREDNNTATGGTLALGSAADLTVASVVAPPAVLPGAAFTAQVTVCNQGTARAAATDVSLVLSRDSLITRADPVLAGVALDALDPGRCATREVSLVAPSEPGSGFLGALADSLELEEEPREDDNGRAGGALVVGSGADLTVSILELPSIVDRQDLFITPVRVCNQGTVPAGTDVRLFLSEDAHRDDYEMDWGWYPVETLAPGQCMGVRVPRADYGGLQLPEGRWHWLAAVTPRDEVPELRHDDNVDARPLEVGARLDFAIAALELPTGVLPGAPFSARVTVCNEGTASGSTQVRLARSWSPLYSVPEDTLGQVATPSLLPGQCARVPVPAQAGLAGAGVHTLAAVADPERTTDEPREDDNVRTARLAVGELPDFTVRGVTVPVQAAVPASETQVSVRVCNEGTAAGGPEVELLLSEDAVIGAGDMPLGSVLVDTLAPGLCTTVDVPVSLWVPSDGTWHVGARVDPYGGQAELHEDNNASAGVAVGVGRLPDFTVTQVRAPAGVRQDESFPLTVEVCNVGTEAGEVDVSLHASLDAEVTLADTLLGTQGFGLLGAGRCSMLELPVPAGMQPRQGAPWYVGVIADAGRTRQELSETNNTGPSAQVGVGELPDVILTRVVVPPAVQPGAELPVRMTVCNQGTGWASNVVIEASLSPDPERRHFGAHRSGSGVHPLAPGDCTTGELLMTASTGPGTWYLLPEVFLWSGPELSTENNRGHAVPVHVGLLPDFTVTSVEVPSGARPGQDVEAHVTVCNQGTEPGGTDVALFVSRDAELSVEDRMTGASPTDPLQVGQCAVYLLPVGTLSSEVGTWYVGAVVDRSSQGAELSEENNTHAGVPVGVGILPDFTVTSVQAPPSVLRGGAFSASVTVCNQGNEPGSPALSLHLSLDEVITRDDLALSPVVPVGMLAAGACTVRELSAQAMVPREGTWYLGAVVDPERRAAELVESNNASEAWPLGVGQRPDLVVADIQADTLVRPGTPTPVNVRVCNQGTAFVSTPEVMVALTRLPEVPLPYEGYGTLAVGGLSPGACRWVTTEYYLYSGDVPRYLTAWVDPYRMVSELIETNNQRIGPRMEAVERADLVMGAVQAPATVDPGKPFTASAQVCNQGVVPATAQVAFHLSPDAQVTVQDPVIGTASPVTLAPGQCATATAQAEPPGAGSFHLAAIADGAGAVPEYSDADNVGPASALRVVSAGMDFAVTALEVSPIVRQSEERISSMTVCNLGLTAGDTRVGFYSSPDARVDTADVRLVHFGPYFLQPGECRHLFLRMLPPGAGYMAAIADPENERPEGNEQNNVSPIVRAVAGDVPDLTIASLKAPAFEHGDGPLPVEVTVCNQGTVSTAPTVVRFQLVDGASSLEGRLGDPSLSVPALDRNQCVRLEQSLDSQSNAARDWTLVATVDATAQQAEAFEDNNTAQAAVRLGDSVELAVTRVTAPSSVPPGGRFTAEVTLCNSGRIRATEVRVALLLSADATPESGVQVGLGSLSGLGKECAVFPVEGTVPSQGLTGELHLLARAELVSPSGRESFLGDNVLAGPRLGTGSGPDLVVSSVEAPLALVAPESAVEVSVQLCNQGTAVAGSNRVQVSFVPGDEGTRQPVLGGTVSVGAVPAGACIPVTVAAVAPQARGTWRPQADVDPDNTVPESVEGNNGTRGELLSVQPYPKLVVTGLQAPSSVRLGQTFTATAMVCNQDPWPVGGSYPVRFSFQTEDGFPARDLFEGRIPEGLAAGACAQVGLSGVPAVLPRQGAWRLVARVGERGLFPRELDSIYTRGVTLGVGSGPDFVLTSVSGPTTVRAGASYGTTVTVCNQGTVSGTATVSAFLSRDDVVTLPDGQGMGDVTAGQAAASLSVGQCRTLTVPSQARVGAGDIWYVGAYLTPMDLVPGNNGRAGARIAVTP